MIELHGPAADIAAVLAGIGMGTLLWHAYRSLRAFLGTFGHDRDLRAEVMADNKRNILNPKRLLR